MSRLDIAVVHLRNDDNNDNNKKDDSNEEADNGAVVETMTVVLRGGECDVRCVVVGDDAVGKTSMLMGYATNRYPTQHVPSVFDNYAGTLQG